VLAWNLLLCVQIDDNFDYKKEEVMEVKDFGGIPEGSPEEPQTGTDAIFSLNAKAEKEKDEKEHDPMWSCSSSLPSAWLFVDE